MRRLPLIVLAFLALSTGPAAASGGRYVFVGGTTYQRNQVTQALQVSTFNWNLVPTVKVVIDPAPDAPSEATVGVVTLNADLLNSGEFSWGVVQHEFGHELDFSLLNAADRTSLQQALGGASWWDDPFAPLQHDQMSAERFATMMSVAYWPAYWSNCFYPRPGNLDAENSSMSPAAFRTLMNGLLAQKQ